MNKVFCLCCVLLVLGGCTTIDELKSTKTYKSKVMRDGSVNVASRATGVSSGRIGSTTVMTIPVGSIKAQGDTSANIMKGVRKALTAAGYNSQDTAFTSADAGYVRAHVENIEFGNFLFSSWGTIILHLRLETRDGALLWKTRIRSSVNAINNYDRTAIVAMNRLVKDMTKVFAKEDFYLATQRIKRFNDFLQEDSSLNQASADMPEAADDSAGDQ